MTTKQAWDWLVTSSADPNKVAVTVKGALSTAAGLVIMASPLFHLSIGSDQINAVVDALVQIVVIALTIFSGCLTLFGLARKIYLTLTNKV